MNDNQRRGGISFCGLLTIAFIVLKLTGFITWSWRWVLAPTWIPLAIAVILTAVYVVCKWVEEK